MNEWMKFFILHWLKITQLKNLVNKKGMAYKGQPFPSILKKSNPPFMKGESELWQFIVCDNRTQSPALLQIIFKFCAFLPKFSNILLFFCPFPEICTHVLTFYNRPWLQRSTIPFFLFKNNSLVKVICLLIRFNKTKSLLWNTKNTKKTLYRGGGGGGGVPIMIILCWSTKIINHRK